MDASLRNLSNLVSKVSVFSHNYKSPATPHKVLWPRPASLKTSYARHHKLQRKACVNASIEYNNMHTRSEATLMSWPDQTKQSHRLARIR